MTRSTKADKARQLNAARKLLEDNTELSEAAQSLSREFDLSLRQAYRYLEEAARLEAAGPDYRGDRTHHPEASAEHRASAARVCEEQRSDNRDGRHARLGCFSRRPKKAWLSGAQGVAHFKFISTMRLIDCANPSSRRRTTFWSPDESAWLARG